MHKVRRVTLSKVVSLCDVDKTSVYFDKFSGTKADVTAGYPPSDDCLAL